MTFKSLGVPILFVSDNPASFGGLSRIGRDLACLAATDPQWRVGYLGRGEGNKRRFPFVMYPFHESGQWGENVIREVWEDFSAGENGIIMTLDDASRRLWFTQSQGLPADLQRFLGPERNFLKWGYFPVDGVGINGVTLGIESRQAVAGYDRVLAASEWGANVLKAGGRADTDWMPHGIHADIFHPISKAREQLNGSTDGIYVGCIMANQSRKDFPEAFRCAAQLKSQYGSRFKFWMHTNTLLNAWNVYALASECGVADCIEVTTELSDHQLALRYSACDCTILPSGGEGFGFPIAESLSCGTACIVTDYAAGQEIVPAACRVLPMALKTETQYNVNRAVISGIAFANAAYGQIEEKRRDWDFRQAQLVDSVKHLAWANLKYPWLRWLREGL